MHERKERIAELGIGVIFVACDEAGAVRNQLARNVDLAFPIGCDPDRVSYRAWGLSRAPWWKIWLDPAVWLRYAKLLASGEKLTSGGADPLQLGGDFVVDAQGVIAYARPQVRDDRPPVGKLIRIAERLAL